jgi:coenzyme Q-binding protein COQ10
MPRFSSSRLVRHKAENMFDLVADVEKYPQFVPLCQNLVVKKRIEDESGITVLVADMTVAYKVIRETFTSRVTLDKAHLTILVEYIDGPFSHLENRWTFKDTDGPGSEVGFSIDYEFRSRTLGLVMGAMFDAAFKRFASAFEARADQVYGVV